MVVFRDQQESGNGGYCLNGYEFQFYKMRRVEVIDDNVAQHYRYMKYH